METNILGDGKKGYILILFTSKLKYYEEAILVVFHNCLFGIWKLFFHRDSVLIGGLGCQSGSQKLTQLM
jgi:hypothetical protein